MLNVQGVPSPYLGDSVTDQDVVEAFFAAREFYTGDPGRDLQTGDVGVPQVPEGKSAREYLADLMRDQLRAISGQDYSAHSDAELLDTVQHTIFPNFHPWGGFKSNICYRWRPNGVDPDSCIFETIIMADVPAGQEKPPSVPVHWVPEEGNFCDVPQLGLLGPVFDQDLDNMIWVQKGMKATRKRGLTLGQYQESRIRHHHQTLLKYLER
jgi:hypothetical protein